MRALQRLLCILCLAAASAATAAAAPPAQTRTEIAHLLAHLGQSGCAFYRNGSWHAGDAARRHLQRKYEYLARRKLVDDTEQFIARAASASSVSGRAYLVRCGEAPPVESADWLLLELRQLREAPLPAGSLARD